MGVTYKLKDEIVDFLLRQKRANPHASCRKLAIVVEENFKIHVSKSSINAILKDAQLSSPVGRSPLDVDKIKKFYIPKEKKVQLFGLPAPADKIIKNVRPAEAAPSSSLVEKKPKETKEIVDPPEKPIVLSREGERHETEEKITAAVEVNSEDNKDETVNVLLPDPLGQRSIEPPPGQPEEEDDQGRRFEIIKMEPFFAMTAARDFFQRPLLENFFKRHASFSDREIQVVDVLYCFLPMVLERPAIVLDQENLWIWLLNGFEEPPQIDEIEHIIKYLNVTKISRFDFFLEIGYFCSFVNFVKFVLDNQKELFFDGRLKFLSQEITGFSPPCPVERSVEEVTRFMNGEEALILFCLSSQTAAENVGELINICEAKDNKIKKIVLMETKEKQILEFAHFLRGPRNFMLTVKMLPNQFEQMFKISLKFSPEQKTTRCGKEVMYVDLAAQHSLAVSGAENLVPLRIIAFYEMDGGLAEICLTNISQKIMPVQRFENAPQNFTQNTEPYEFNNKYSVPSEAAFDSPDSEMTMAASLLTLKDLIFGYATAMYSSISKNNDFFIKIRNASGYINIKRSKILVGLQLEDAKNSGETTEIFNILSLYGRKTYGPRRITYIY